MDTHPLPTNYKSNKSLYWDSESSETIVDCEIFSIQRVNARPKSILQSSQKSFYTIDFDSWVNVIPLTADNHVVMVEQYRHGVQSLTLEIPGGAVEPGDPSVLYAAKRELREETGCVSDDWIILGQNHPNPAIQGNSCFTYLARATEVIEEPTFDTTGTERTHRILVPIEKVESMISTGRISHALVIAAFYFLSVEFPEYR